MTLEDRVEAGDNNRISVPITVIVVDENDNRPEFERVSGRMAQRRESESGGRTVGSDDRTADCVGRFCFNRCNPCGVLYEKRWNVTELSRL